MRRIAFYDPTMSDIRALVVADVEGIIRMWSSGSEALFGYPAADALGRSLELLIPSDSANATGGHSTPPWRLASSNWTR